MSRSLAFTAPALGPALFRTLGGALALLASAVAMPAQAACYDRQTASAAKLHEFETMMMVVSLRCARIGVNLRGDFDGMVRVHQAPFGQAANRLRLYLGGDGVDPHSGQFDRYATVLANRYGGGATRVDDCQVLGQVVAELARLPDGEVLSAVADVMVARPQLASFACSPDH